MACAYISSCQWVLVEVPVRGQLLPVPVHSVAVLAQAREPPVQSVNDEQLDAKIQAWSTYSFKQWNFNAMLHWMKHDQCFSRLRNKY